MAIGITLSLSFTIVDLLVCRFVVIDFGLRLLIRLLLVLQLNRLLESNSFSYFFASFIRLTNISFLYDYSVDCLLFNLFRVGSDKLFEYF